LTKSVRIVDLGLTEYQATYAKMRAFTDARDSASRDEIWLTEHEPVFTQGQAGRPQHILFNSEIPVVQSNRGGQVTYHGPGQITAYLLFDLRRLGLSVTQLVNRIEQLMLNVCANCGITAGRRAGAPGIYVGNDKIGALGLRVSRGCSYHGLSLNVEMDLRPYEQINPCGLTDVRAIDMQAFGSHTIASVKPLVIAEALRVFDLEQITERSESTARES